MHTWKRALLMTLVVVPCLARANPGRIVVNYDDWTLTDTGFQAPNDPGTYLTNIAAWFTDGDPGSFIGYGTTFHLGSVQIVNALAAAGHSYVLSSATTLDSLELCNHDGVFLGAMPLGEDPGNVARLAGYVNEGGNVYILGGTDFYGSIAADAQVLNSFLNQFGLDFASQATLFRGSFPVSSSHPVLSGVDSLFADNGTAISDLDPGDPWNEILAFDLGGGVVATFDGSMIATTVSGNQARIAKPSIHSYPSPASGDIRIVYVRPVDRGGNLQIYDITGRLVRSLPIGPSAGEATWDGRDSSGRDASAGLYFARFSDGIRGETARVILVR